MKLPKFTLFLVYLLVGLYLVNVSLGLYSIPDVVEDFDDLILLFAGVLILFHGLIWLRPRRRLKGL